MTKQQYLAELSRRLARLPQSEINEALEYCSEYFEDAASDEEAVSGLGTPQRLATQILGDRSAQSLRSDAAAPYRLPVRETVPAYNMPTAPFPTYTSASSSTPLPNVSGPYTGANRQAPPTADTRYTVPHAPAGTTAASPYTTEAGRRNNLHAIWYVILGICALPVALPLIIAAVAVIIALVAVCIVFVCALAGLIALLLVGCVTTVVGGIRSLAVTGFSMLSFGTALSLLGLALILIPLLVLLVVWLIGIIGRTSARLFAKLKERSEKKNEKQS